MCVFTYLGTLREDLQKWHLPNINTSGEKLRNATVHLSQIKTSINPVSGLFIHPSLLFCFAGGCVLLSKKALTVYLSVEAVPHTNVALQKNALISAVKVTVLHRRLNKCISCKILFKCPCVHAQATSRISEQADDECVLWYAINISIIRISRYSKAIWWWFGFFFKVSNRPWSKCCLGRRRQWAVTTLIVKHFAALQDPSPNSASPYPSCKDFHITKIRWHRYQAHKKLQGIRSEWDLCRMPI